MNEAEVDHSSTAGLRDLAENRTSIQRCVAVQHDSFETRRREIRAPALPKVLLLIPHLGKKPLKTAKEARTVADHKAQVKWEKPAASGAKNNLVVPLCYDAPWLGEKWF